MISHFETRSCTECGENYEHEPMMLGDTDMLEHVTVCEACSTKIRRRDERAEREEKARGKWEKSIPKEYRLTRTDHPDYPANIHDKAMGWLRSTDGDRKPFLGILGISGKGKTRVASQLAKRILWEGGFVRWVGSYQFQWACQRQFTDKDGAEASKALKLHQAAKNLVFDDIGALKSTEVVSDCLYALLEHRSANALPMIWTSNESPEEMLGGKGISNHARSRNISRLEGYSHIIES